jgi:hypothetical protein
MHQILIEKEMTTIMCLLVHFFSVAQEGSSRTKNFLTEISLEARNIILTGSLKTTCKTKQNHKWAC